MKVLIVVPSNGLHHAAFTMSLVGLVVDALMKGIYCKPVSAESACVTINRENGVATAKANGFTHVLFLDSDMNFPLDTVGRLAKRNVDVVGCLYSSRIPPYRVLGILADPKARGFVEATELPGGCVLVKMDVFDRLERPFFRMPVLPNKETQGEDYYFSESLRKAGIKIWADTDLSKELIHYGMVECKLPEDF